jgi:hypothetical protein
MLCVVCPHCHQMMTAPEDAVGESVACPGCKKSLQVPPNAPRLPQHLSPNGVPPVPAAAAHAKAAAGAAGGRVGAAVAAPPVPAAPPAMPAPAPTTRSTLPKGVLVVVALVIVVGVAAVVIVPRLGGKKAVVSKRKEIPNLPGTDPSRDPIPASDLTAAKLFGAYFENSLAADDHYKDKEVTLAGRVAAVRVQDEVFVDLQGLDRAKDQTKLVRCYFGKGHADRLKTFGYNHPIKLQGTCRGMANGRVVLRECNFVSE